MKMHRIAKLITGSSISIFLMLGLNGCASNNPPAPVMPAAPGGPPSSSFASSAVCNNNPFLQKYQCSFMRVEQSARAGDPDAQYALGYLYYYGIGTTQDRQTGLIWIKKAAAQGQTVAQEALRALSGTKSSEKAGSSTVASSSSNTTTASTGSATPSASATQPERPLTDYLPNYGEKRVDTTAPPTVNLSNTPNQ